MIGPGELAALLPWGPGDSLSVLDAPAAARLLQARLVQAGWWAARVEAEVGAAQRNGNDVTLRVDAGERVEVGEVDVSGARLFAPGEIRSRMELRPGQPFSLTTLESDAARILRAYSERGYPLARVYPSRFRRAEDGRLAFVVRIGEGPAASLESVRVFGSRDTDEGAVARIAGVRPGDAWDVRKIERMSARLRREGLFTSVSEPRIVAGSRDNLLAVELAVEEGPSSSVFGVLGYNPRREGGGDVVGQAEVDLRNLLGTARRASLRFAKQPGDVRDLAFRYREPWVLGTPVSVEVGAAQALRDTLYSRTDLDAGVAVPTGDFATFRLAAERRSSSFDDAAGNSVSETATGGSGAWDVDLRDRRVNPSRGWLGHALLGARETKDGTVRTRVETGGQILLPFRRRLVISEEAAFRGVWSTADDVPLFEQYYLGGTNTLRGYREEQFHGARVWWVRSELRYRLAASSRVYVFGDVGGYRFDVLAVGLPARREEDVLVGGGVGAALATRGSGAVRFELALGRGDGFSDAKVHVGLEQEF
jgi:outer membrane protein insertion porin family